MRKTTLLLLCGALAMLCACQKDGGPESRFPDDDLTGEKVDAKDFPASVRKVFILNEGSMGSNNATLDFLRCTDGTYVTGAFRKRNAQVAAGLGDVGNDVLAIGDELWIVVNNSGLVEVLSAKDESEIAAVAIPTPRCIATDGRYAYVTSWAGAFASGSYDSNGYYTVTDARNPKGQVYRIDLTTKKVSGTVEVGYQPEGIACYGGKLYVANSGGISSQLPPDYAYDRTVSIIDVSSFSVSRTVDVQVNLKSVYADGAGKIYVTSLGDYWSTHSGLYMLDAADPGKVTHVSDFVSLSALFGDTLYCIGTESEFDWSAAHVYSAWTVKSGVRTPLPLTLSETTPYSLCVADAETLLVGDAKDYFNPGTISCYVRGSKLWTVTAGVCPGHFALY